MNLPPRPAAAFTLLQLLVALAVIAVLTVLLLPVHQAMRQRTFALQCTNHLKQWGVATAIYQQEHQGKFPVSAPWGDGKRWYHSEAPLVKILYQGSLSPQQTVRWNKGYDINGCPAHSDAPYGKHSTLRYYSYAMNRDLPAIYQRISQIANPAKVAYIIDAREASPVAIFMAANYKNLIGYKHQGHANVLFVDGHVEAIKEFRREHVVPE